MKNIILNNIIWPYMRVYNYIWLYMSIYDDYILGKKYLLFVHISRYIIIYGHIRNGNKILNNIIWLNLFKYNFI